MEKRDNFIVAVVGIVTIFCSFYFKLNYTSIAESGLTLSSITLAVYIAAIIGLINSKLAIKMQGVITTGGTKSQLGILTSYFKTATFCAIVTIVVSSIVLLMPIPETVDSMLYFLWSVLSKLGLLFYAENITFLVMIIRFILNRQIWDN